jgi:hypothetical protein
VEAGFVALFDGMVGTITEHEMQALRQVEGPLGSLRRGLDFSALDADPGAARIPEGASSFEAAFVWLYDALAAATVDGPLALSDGEFELLWETRRSTTLTTPQAIARLLAFAARAQR